MSTHPAHTGTPPLGEGEGGESFNDPVEVIGGETSQEEVLLSATVIEPGVQEGPVGNLHPQTPLKPNTGEVVAVPGCPGVQQ